LTGDFRGELVESDQLDQESENEDVLGLYLLHEGLGLLVLLEVVQDGVDVESDHLRCLGALGADRAEQRGYVVVACGVVAVQFEDQQGDEVLLLEQLADFVELCLFLLCRFLDGLQDLFVEEGDAAIDSHPYVFFLDDPENERADEHGLQEDVQFHGGLHQQNGDELAELV
jgi:hypothetical protein